MVTAMRPLHLKLFRDLSQMKGQMLAVAAVMMCGLTVLIMSRSLILSLETTRDAYYRDMRFGDVFCDLKRAPNSLRARLQRIPGVAGVETRVCGTLVLDLPGMKEPAGGTILSLPEQHVQQLNLVYLRSGRFPEVGARNEVVASEAFANAHGFQPGNTVDAIIYGHRQRLRIVGIGLSPEFVIEGSASDLVPDPLRFGVFWMNERELGQALNMRGGFNNVVVDLAPGADASAVKAELEHLLKPYGSLTAYDRSEQNSALQISDQIRNLNVGSVIFPVVFLSIAAFMTSAALSRVVRLQREQIAQLKASGYSSTQVGFHYLQFALVIVVIGTVGGALCGFLVGIYIVQLYHRFFHFPSLTFQPNWWAIVIALAAGSITSFLGVYGAVRQAVKLPPAEAMRPEPPADFKPSVMERIGLHRLVSPSFRMALRNLERKPWQAFFTSLGLALATAIPFIPGTLRESIVYLQEFQWSLTQRQDVTLRLIEPGSATALSALSHLPGVMSVEPFRMVPARLRVGQREHWVSVTGMVREPQLSRVLDGHANPLVMPLSGLLLSQQLAELLGVKPGDSIRVDVEEGRQLTLHTVVAGTITDFAGVRAYMEINALRRLLREGGTVSGVHATVDRARWDEFLARVKESPRIGSLVITEASRKSFSETTGQMLDKIQAVYLMFAIIVAVGVVYNSARIALSERSRDFATLRVIGFSHTEVASVLIGELTLLTIIGIPFGLWLGAQLAKLIVDMSGTETVRLPFVLTTRTYAMAVLIVVLSSLMSFGVVSRRIRKLDLLGVLKAIE
jgi:putative ABC transport system permease protein